MAGEVFPIETLLSIFPGYLSTFLSLSNYIFLVPICADCGVAELYKILFLDNICAGRAEPPRPILQLVPVVSNVSSRAVKFRGSFHNIICLLALSH